MEWRCRSRTRPCAHLKRGQRYTPHSTWLNLRSSILVRVRIGRTSMLAQRSSHRGSRHPSNTDLAATQARLSDNTEIPDVVRRKRRHTWLGHPLELRLVLPVDWVRAGACPAARYLRLQYEHDRDDGETTRLWIMHIDRIPGWGTTRRLVFAPAAIR